MESEHLPDAGSRAAVANCELLLLDLDNTLYAEVDYLFPAYRQAAQAVSDECGLADPNALEAFLQTTFVSKGRQGLFQAACEAFSLDAAAVTTMLQVLRSAQIPGGLRAFPFMVEIVRRANGLARPYAIITNGNVAQQRNKIAHLEPRQLFAGARVYYCDEYGRKPDPGAILAACRDVSVRPDRAIMIGDHEVDRLAAAAAGVRFLHVDVLRTPA